MTQPDYTHITLVCDRSGSMGSVQGEAEKAINMFLIEQQSLPGQATLLLRQFDTRHDTVFDGPLEGFRTFTLVPAGMTALWDAVGMAIKLTGERLAALPEADRPSKVAFVIQTDGAENSSSEYTSEQVRALIKDHEDQYSWQFVFLGMGKDAWGGASAMGVQNFVAATANTGASNAAAYGHVGSTLRSYRSGAAQNMAYASATVADDGTLTDKDGKVIDPNAPQATAP